MCGLAQVMRGLGYDISGSDLREQPSVAALREGGIPVAVGHAAANVAAADCVVYSGAVPPDNPERRAAMERGIPVIPRAQMLGEVLRFKPGAAVAGTHGKTTISSMLAAILAADGRDPTCIIGGQLVDGGGNFRVGGGEFVVAEADESDASFLHLHPVAALVANIDDDHLSAFGGSRRRLRRAFRNFLENLPFYGAAVLCADDRSAAALANRLSSIRVVRYGFHSRADVRAADVRAEGMRMFFTLHLQGESHAAELHAAGRHNVQNAAGACALAAELGASADSMLKAMRDFCGTRRRLELRGDIAAASGRALLLDDYGHHPTEIAATIAAARGAHPNRRLLLVFQPHRYTRTRDVFSKMLAALSLADELILLDVYPAGESPIAGADSDSLAAALKGKVNLTRADSLEDAAARTLTAAQDGDLILTMGAGDVGALPAMLKKRAAA